MAMNSSNLAEEIMNAMEAEGLLPRNALNDGHSEKIWRAVATAVVAHITANADVTISGGSSSGTHPSSVS